MIHKRRRDYAKYGGGKRGFAWQSGGEPSVCRSAASEMGLSGGEAKSSVLLSCVTVVELDDIPDWESCSNWSDGLSESES